MRIKERIPREKFEAILGPALKALGARQCILRINAAARTAIPRQTPYRELVPKLELLCYEQNRPQLENELERIFDEYLDRRLANKAEEFYRLGEEVNKRLQGERLPENEQERAEVQKVLSDIHGLLRATGLSAEETDAVFALKAYTEVLEFYRQKVATT